MEIVILDTPEEVERFAASILLAEVSQNSSANLGLATGRTMEGIYPYFVEAYKKGLKFSRVKTFNLDEYVGISPAHESSFYHYMDKHLFRDTDIDAENIFIPHGRALDSTEEIKRFEAAIQRSGGIDIQLLGVGNNGHIGFNEPPSSFGSPTRIVTLAEETRRQNAPAFGGDIERVPRKAYTMGLRTILAAKRIVLVATGSHKARAIAGAIEGPIKATLPASAIQIHPDPWVILDSEAAQELNLIEYYKAQASESDSVKAQHDFIYRFMG